jgi:hypothetical protein
MLATSVLFVTDTAAEGSSDPLVTSAQAAKVINLSIAIKTLPPAVKATLKEFSSALSFDLTGSRRRQAQSRENSLLKYSRLQSFAERRLT